jgi:hypothetical protein
MTHQPTDIFEPAPLSEYDRMLIDLYMRSGRVADELAYTDEFERIYTQLREAGDRRSKAEVFRRLLSFRKSGRLPRVA